MDWNKKWRQFSRLQLTPQIMSFYFKILNSATNFFISGKCKCGLEINSFWHVISCHKLNYIINFISKYTKTIFNEKFLWHKKHYYNTKLNKKATQITITALWCLWKIRCKWIFEDKIFSRIEIVETLEREFKRVLVHLTQRLNKESQVKAFLKAWGSFIPPGNNHASVRMVGNNWIFDLQLPPGNN